MSIFKLQTAKQAPKTNGAPSKPKKKRRKKTFAHKNKTAAPVVKKSAPLLTADQEIDLQAIEKKEAAENDFSDLNVGVPTLKELIAPPSFTLHRETYLKVGNKWVRSFYLQGYPKVVYVGWLDEIYNSNYDTDLSIYIEPINTGESLQHISNKMTSLLVQLGLDEDRGNISKISALQGEIADLKEQKIKLERSTEKLFLTQTFLNLFADSEDELERQTRSVDDFFTGRTAQVLPLYMREDKAFKSGAPYGKSYVTDKMRRVNTGQLVALFPFYNSEINHIKGVKLGVNRMTGNDIAVDFYDPSLLNANINVFGVSGSGKTFFVMLLTLRSVLRGIRTVIIDPENDYYAATQAMGGAVFNIETGSDSIPNPFDIEEEEYLDTKTNTIKYKLDLNAKIVDLTNLIHVMYPHMTDLQESFTTKALEQTYDSLGFYNDDPNSLYEEETNHVDQDKGVIHLEKVKKEMPTFTQFWLLLKSQQHEHPELQEEVEVLRKFLKGEPAGLFDTETPESLSNYEQSPIVSFNISALEESTLRPIGMYVVLQWAWEKFGKKNYNINKRVVVDEAWMLLSTNFAGHKYTARMLENMSRRFRKRHGGLLASSQKFDEFTYSNEGKAILTNAFTNVFLKQADTDFRSVASFFHLSEGEASTIQTAVSGNFLIKVGDQSAIGYAESNKYEYDLINASLHQKKEKQNSNAQR